MSLPATTEDEQRWMTAHDKLGELIEFLKEGETREEWELTAVLMSVRGSMYVSASLDRLRKVMAAYTDTELQILNARNN